jgi:hypothetical protein
MNGHDSDADPWAARDQAAPHRRAAAAAEGTLTGTQDGVLRTPNGDVAPTGRPVELRWAAVYVIDGDTLKSEHLFFDQMDFLGQLGLVPG